MSRRSRGATPLAMIAAQLLAIALSDAAFACPPSSTQILPSPGEQPGTWHRTAGTLLGPNLHRPKRPCRGDHARCDDEWIGTLAGEMVVHLTLVNNCVISVKYLLRHQLGRIRDVRIDPTGVVYVLTDGGQGTLYRLDDSLEDAGPEHSHL